MFTKLGSYSLEVVSHLKLILLCGNVSLHFGVGVVDDGQEHVEQHKEYKEHVEDEVDWSKNTICSFQLVEVEVSKDDTEQSESEIKANCLGH